MPGRLRFRPGRWRKELAHLLVQWVEIEAHWAPECDHQLLSEQDLISVDNKQTALVVSEDPVDAVHTVDVDVRHPEVLDEGRAHRLHTDRLPRGEYRHLTWKGWLAAAGGPLSLGSTHCTPRNSDRLAVNFLSLKSRMRTWRALEQWRPLSPGRTHLVNMYLHLQRLLPAEWRLDLVVIRWDAVAAATHRLRLRLQLWLRRREERGGGQTGRADHLTLGLEALRGPGLGCHRHDGHVGGLGEREEEEEEERDRGLA